MNFPMVLSRMEVAEQDQVNFVVVGDAVNEGLLSGDMLRNIVSEIQSGLSVSTETVTTLQGTLDALLPGIAPLGLTLLCVWLLRKKVSPITIIFGLFIVGTLGYVLGILG